MLAGLALVALLFGFLIGPQFFNAANLELMARQTAIVCVAALGMTMVIVAGGIDLSVGSVIALSTVVTAQLLRDGSWPLVAAAGAIAAGAACGLMNGVLITGLRVVPFIITLGTMLLVRGGAKGLADERRLEAPITWLNSMLRTVRDGSGLLLPWGIWVVILLAVMVADHAAVPRASDVICSPSARTSAPRGCAASVSSAAKSPCIQLRARSPGSRASWSSRVSRLATRRWRLAQSWASSPRSSSAEAACRAARAQSLEPSRAQGIMTLIQIGCSQHGLPNWVQEIVTGTIIVFAVALDHFRQSHHLRFFESRMKITALSVLDLRFPTSKDQVGTDAVHTDPDYSAAYVILETDAGLEGHGLTFTVGRGNEVCAAAIEAFRHLVVGRDLGRHHIGFRRVLAQPRRRIATSLAGSGERASFISRSPPSSMLVWDLYGKAERKPVWKLLADMTPEQLVSCIDFHHITDALTRDEALAILDRQAATKATREAELLKSGYPAYTTSVGWLGYSDEKIHRLCRRRWPKAGRTSRSKLAASPRTICGASLPCAPRLGPLTS